MNSTTDSKVAEWEADIKIRRNGRLVRREISLGSTPEAALYFASNDLERWAQSHPENDTEPGGSES